MPRTITAVVHKDGVPINVTGTKVLTTVDGAVTFADIRVHKPTVGAYSVNFTTPDLGMTPRTAAPAVRATATWDASVAITVVEGTAHALRVLQEPAPLTVDNKEVCAQGRV